MICLKTKDEIIQTSAHLCISSSADSGKQTTTLYTFKSNQIKPSNETITMKDSENITHFVLYNEKRFIFKIRRSQYGIQHTWTKLSHCFISLIIRHGRQDICVCRSKREIIIKRITKNTIKIFKNEYLQN